MIGSGRQTRSAASHPMVALLVAVGRGAARRLLLSAGIRSKEAAKQVCAFRVQHAFE
jgi:hypothetical protein